MSIQKTLGFAGNIFLVLISSCFLTSCMGTVWTGASLVYDRHSVYKKVDDYQLAGEANRILFKDHFFRDRKCFLDMAVFRGDVLVAGHVPNHEIRNVLNQRLSGLTGYHRLFNQVAVNASTGQGLGDSWITASIRSKILSDSTIDPDSFKIVTVDSIVYIMGEARSDQALIVLDLASKTRGVLRVVKVFRTYTLN